MIKYLTPVLATAALALSVTPLAAQDGLSRAEQRLATMLEGRVAGEPQSCISTFNSNRLRVVEGVGFVYDQGDTVWVGRATDPRDVGRWDVPVIDRFSGSRLCHTDMVHTVDRTTGIFTGVIFIEEFVPYRRVEG